MKHGRDDKDYVNIVKIKEVEPLLHMCSERYPRRIRSCHRRCSIKKVFLKISQNSQEKTCSKVSFLVKFQASACNYIKKKLPHRCFPANFAKLLRSSFLQNTSGRQEVFCGKPASLSGKPQMALFTLFLGKVEVIIYNQFTPF